VCSSDLTVLGELAAPDKNGVFTAMAALSAIEALGPKAAPLLPLVRGLKGEAGSPDPRFASYVPRLIVNLTGDAPGAKTKNKKKSATP
jgi:hypothetical protein